jgi:hypothetical protein
MATVGSDPTRNRIIVSQVQPPRGTTRFLLAMVQGQSDSPGSIFLLAMVRGQLRAKPFCATATMQPGRSGTGQLQNKLGGAVGSAMPGDAAGVEFGNSPHLGQTQAATATRLPTRKERIEEMFLPGRVWSGAIVFDDYLDLVGNRAAQRYS